MRTSLLQLPQKIREGVFVNPDAQNTQHSLEIAKRDLASMLRRQVELYSKVHRQKQLVASLEASLKVVGRG